MDHHVISPAEYRELLAARAERDRLLALVNTPELVNFPKAVHLEAAHQLDRWGTEDRRGKEANDWFWLVGHLASRALEHHKEAERLVSQRHSLFFDQISYHREKAVHHCITAAAALNHWHASMLGKKTAMQPGHAPAIAAASRAGSLP